MSLLAGNILTIILLLMAMGQQVCSRQIYAYFEKIECNQYDFNYGENVKCWLSPDQDGQLMMNAEFKLKKDVLDLSAKFQFIVEQNRKNMTYLSLNIDICDLLGQAIRNPVVRLIHEETRRKSNIPLECPLKKGIVYFIRNFTINSKLVPPFAPRMRWISDWNFYSKTDAGMVKLVHFASSGRVDHTKPKNAVTA